MRGVKTWGRKAPGSRSRHGVVRWARPRQRCSVITDISNEMGAFAWSRAGPTIRPQTLLFDNHPHFCDLPQNCGEII